MEWNRELIVPISVFTKIEVQECVCMRSAAVVRESRMSLIVIKFKSNESSSSPVNRVP